MVEAVFPTQAISFNGQTVHIAEEMNLTEMWKASKKPASFKPANWARFSGAEFIQATEKKASQGCHLIRSVKGRSGGTFAHWQIGMEYARYLSPELAAVCNQIVKDFVETPSPRSPCRSRHVPTRCGWLRSRPENVRGTQREQCLRLCRTPRR